jgi:hypothetical protein
MSSHQMAGILKRDPPTPNPALTWRTHLPEEPILFTHATAGALCSMLHAHYLLYIAVFTYWN